MPAVASIIVEVQQVEPMFVNTPEEGALARAYPNCPMPMVPVQVWKPNAAITLSLSFGPTTEDERAGLKLASPEALGFTSQSGCAQTPNNQHRYSCNRYPGNRADVAVLQGMTLQWTPPLEAAGAVYKVCVVAEDDAPSKATRCLTIHVSRCMYCSDSESLAHLATRFRTNWLQIWSANDPEWVQENQQSLQESQVKAWAATDFPHKVEQGTLIRLGPVYTTRAEHGFQELAQRFGTTLWALLELNPDLASLAEDGAPIPIGQDVCVLPGICSASPGSEIDRR